MPPPAVTELGAGRRDRPALAARRPRRLLRARRQGRLPVERRHERRARAGRRRRVDRARLAAAGATSAGGVHPTILGAAGLLGVDEVYAMGGAGAIGALAYGVPDLGLDPVDVITGPGNVYVAAAKRLVRGVVGIDAEAGPDRDPRDRRRVGRPAPRRRRPGQPGRARRARRRRARHRLARARRRGRGRARAPGRARPGTRERVRDGPRRARSRRSCSSTTSTAAAAFSNAYGPEHLEIQTADPGAVLDLIENAGAIFLGAHSPGEPRRLPRGLEPRAADRRPGAVRVGARRVHVPAPAAGHRLRPRGASRAVARPASGALSDAEHLPAHGDAVDARASRRSP